MNRGSSGRAGFAALLTCAIAAGALLRLWILPSQVLLDDEWHGLNQVIGVSLPDVLTTFDAKDNTSLPLNVYYWVLLHTAGWSELTVRLPVIVSGLLGLLLMPLALRKTMGDRAALAFAFLLAVSPFAIFYSRFSRAYGIVMLCCFLSVLYAHRWLSTGDRRSGKSFLAVGTLAAWTHPLAAVVVVVPFALYYGDTFIRRSAGAENPGTMAGTGMGIPAGEVRRYGTIQAALLLPVAWLIFSARSKLPWGEGAWSFSGLGDAVTLLSGATNVPLNLAWYAVLAWGVATLYRNNRLFARLCAATIASYIAVLMVSRPLGLGTGVVVLRYMIVIVPLALTCVAAGIDALRAALPGEAERRGGRGWYRMAPAPAFAALIGLLFVAGPLPVIYNGPNNFTNHSAYQGSYAPLNPAVSEARHVYPGFSVAINDVPEFYPRLTEMADVGTIVEYPLDVTNYNNLFWFYQRVHGKRVVAGYCVDRSLLGHTADVSAGDERAPFRMGMLGADQILSHAPDPGQLKFANMADVTDPAALARYGAGVVILHKYVMALRFLPGGTTDAVRVWYRSVPLIAERCRRFFGPPVYEDAEILCFRIGSS